MSRFEGASAFDVYIEENGLLLKGNQSPREMKMRKEGTSPL